MKSGIINVSGTAYGKLDVGTGYGPIAGGFTIGTGPNGAVPV